MLYSPFEGVKSENLLLEKACDVQIYETPIAFLKRLIPLLEKPNKHFDNQSCRGTTKDTTRSRSIIVVLVKMHTKEEFSWGQ